MCVYACLCVTERRREREEWVNLARVNAIGLREAKMKAASCAASGQFLSFCSQLVMKELDIHFSSLCLEHVMIYYVFFFTLIILQKLPSNATCYYTI